jgi:hypothetical protein
MSADGGICTRKPVRIAVLKTAAFANFATSAHQKRELKPAPVAIRVLGSEIKSFAGTLWTKKLRQVQFPFGIVAVEDDAP